MTIKYKKGDLFEQIPRYTPIIIPHITNDIGAWGSGFVLPLARMFPKARQEYLKNGVNLGLCQMIECGSITIANMCAQTGIMGQSTGDRAHVNEKPIRYEALTYCLRQLEDYCKDSAYPIEVHAPAFGSDRSGGNWPIIHELIEEILVSPSKIVVYYMDDQQKNKMEKCLDFKMTSS